MHRFTRKTTVVTIAMVLLFAGGAYAYWTNSGSGSGTAATGTNVGITVNQTSTVTDMHPGDAPQALSGDFTNTNASPVYVASVTATITSVVKDPGAVAGDCDATDYTLGSPTKLIGHEVAPGTNVDSWTGPTIKFFNKAGTNQDQCKLATVNIGYTSN